MRYHFAQRFFRRTGVEDRGYVLLPDWDSGANCFDHAVAAIDLANNRGVEHGAVTLGFGLFEARFRGVLPVVDRVNDSILGGRRPLVAIVFRQRLNLHVE